MLLVIDNYDSFVFNLARYFQRLGQEIVVVRNDAVDVEGVRAMAPQAVVFSPGPCTPHDAGNSIEIIRQLHASVPMLGICLGHQAIGAALGASVVRAPEPVHGRASAIVHNERGIFAGLPNPLLGSRYHSLVVVDDTLPPCLEVTARTEDGTVMALAHRELPVVGLQFHPESILTEHGYAMLAAFLRMAGIAVGDSIPSMTSERVERAVAARPLPQQPVTF